MVTANMKGMITVGQTWLLIVLLIHTKFRREVACIHLEPNCCFVKTT